eukprot:14026997-Alexandrium_andersonii.AAC.1
MSASLVGSEMCIRDRLARARCTSACLGAVTVAPVRDSVRPHRTGSSPYSLKRIGAPPRAYM